MFQNIYKSFGITAFKIIIRTYGNYNLKEKGINAVKRKNPEKIHKTNNLLMKIAQMMKKKMNLKIKPKVQLITIKEEQWNHLPKIQQIKKS